MSVTDAKMTCNGGTSAALTAPITAGQNITAVWSQWTHKQGPVMVWLYKCSGAFAACDGKGKNWFKIDQMGMYAPPLSGDSWGTAIVVDVSDGGLHELQVGRDCWLLTRCFPTNRLSSGQARFPRTLLPATTSSATNCLPSTNRTRHSSTLSVLSWSFPGVALLRHPRITSTLSPPMPPLATLVST